MNVKKDMSVFADEIQNLKSDDDLNLTQFGATLLAPFSRQTILKTRRKFRQLLGKVGNMDKPFNCFLAIALEVSKELGETPNWNKTSELAKQLGVENAVRVTEDDEFLAKSPSLVKKGIEREARTKKDKFGNTYVKRGPSFDGDTYIKNGESFLKPNDPQPWLHTDSMQRLSKGPEYWQNEKKKFLCLAHEGKVSKKGLEFLVFAGLLQQSDLDPENTGI